MPRVLPADAVVSSLPVAEVTLEGWLVDGAGRAGGCWKGELWFEPFFAIFAREIHIPARPFLCCDSFPSTTQLPTLSALCYRRRWCLVPWDRNHRVALWVRSRCGCLHGEVLAKELLESVRAKRLLCPAWVHDAFICWESTGAKGGCRVQRG